ncbi:MAG: hypothetical protein K9J80_14895 [Sulfuritalea sp.]|nr:hypothetical protein [Sulfuritalea sp.]MCF8184502.1 hypothetical protein [Polynucleobacter sp.]
MIPGPSIFQRTRRPINLLAGAIFLSLTLVYGSAYVRDMLKTSLTQSRNQMDAHQQDLTQKQLDLSNIKTHIAQFGVLREQGLVGTADREGWVEQLGVNREQLHLADTLSYLLKPPQAVADAATLEPEAMTSDEPNSAAATQHDLDFELRGITEPELLNLLRSYRAQVNGRFRVQSCRLSSPSKLGLTAQCTLRFFNLPIIATPS